MGIYKLVMSKPCLCCVVLLHLLTQLASGNTDTTTASSNVSATTNTTTATTTATSSEKPTSKTTTTTVPTTTSSTASTTTEAPRLGVNCTNKPQGWCNSTISGAVECVENTNTCQCQTGHFQSSSTACLPVNDLVPISATVSDITTTSFAVTWSHKDSVRDLPLVHMVTAKRVPVGDNSQEISCNVANSSAASCSGLEPGYRYNVTIKATYNSEQGETVKQESTKPGMPGLLLQQSSNFTAPNVTLKWNSALGRVDNYSVAVRQSDGQSMLDSKTTSDNTTQIVVTGLKAGKNYSVTITANSYGKTSQGIVDTFRTVSTVPGPPRGLTIVAVTSSSIKINWMLTDAPNGDIRAHKVCVKFRVYLDQSYQDLQPCENVSLPDVEYEKGTLTAGTYYLFDVYTINDVGVSSNRNISQRTNETVPGKVNGLDATIIDTSITVTWKRPLQPNGDIITYRVIWFDTANKMNCTVYLTKTVHSGKENSCNQNFTEPDSIQDNQKDLSYKIINLEPHTDYSIMVTAYTSVGAGETDSITRQTNVTVPDAVTDVTANTLNSTAVNISWTIPTVNPGPVTYTVTTRNIIENKTSDQNCSAEGKDRYNMSSCVVSGLEEYWIYSFSVVASTSAGPSGKAVSDNVTTEEAEPGPVSNFTYVLYNKTEDCDATKVMLKWVEPGLYDRNALIVKYVLQNEQISRDFMVPKPIAYNFDNRKFEDTFTELEPEFHYTWKIFAQSSGGLPGQTSSINFHTGVCAPPDWQDSELQDVTEKSSSTRSLTLSLPRSFFKKSDQGPVIEKGLIILPSGSKYYEDEDTSIIKVEELNDWLSAKSSQFSEDYKIKITGNVVEQFEIGAEAECGTGRPGDQFCNGPLPEQFSFKVAAYACTRREDKLLCTVSNPFGPFATQATPTPSGTNSSGLIIALSVVFVLVSCVVAFLFLWYKDIIHPKSWFAKKDDDDDIDFTPLDKVERNRPIKIFRYIPVLEEMHRDTNLILSDQYDDINKIGQMVAESSTTDAARLESNTPKNRWVNILPFDHSRVKLQQIDDDDPTSDYINANYMPGFYNKREYIATQGPLPGTIDDFWRMIWEHEVMVIVMLTQCKEGNRVKCEKYWPDELREPKQYGEVVVNPISISQLDKYNISIFDVSVNGQSRKVTHFHYLDFPDFSANVEFDHFINFVKTVRSHVPHDMTGPMVIHCSAGVGRTGTFIATDRLNLYLNSPKFDESDEVDIFGIVVSMRENRVAMVQTESQYIMIHDCFEKMLEDKRRSLEMEDSTENLYENQGFAGSRPGSHPYPEVLYENVQTSKQQTEL